MDNAMQALELNYRISDKDLLRAGEASSELKLMLKQLGLDHEIVRRTAICMYEGEINMVLHADGGTIRVVVDHNCILLELNDRGPGIADVALAMKPGYTTASDSIREMGFGAGMGLPNMQRYSDEFNIDTVVGTGTTITMKILLPPPDA